MQTILFFSRLGLYLFLICMPLWLKPAIVVAYDSVTIAAWFFLVPLQMCLAYFLHPSRSQKYKFWLGPLTALASCAVITLIFSGLEWDSVFRYLVLSASAFILTRIIFFNKKSSILAALEIFFFAFIYFNFLGFTRSAPEISQEHPILYKATLFFMLLSFLFHIVIIYLAAFPDRSFHKKRNELLVFSSIVIPTFLILAFISPNDFVKHEIAFNNWNEAPPPLPKELDGRGEFVEKGVKGDDEKNGLPLGDRDEKYPAEIQGGGVKRKNIPEKEIRPEEKEKEETKNKNKQKKDGKSSGNSGQFKQEPKLEGVPSEQWNNYKNQSKGEGGSSKQRAVMVVASQIDPVYASESYLGSFSKDGFKPSPLGIEPLNKISQQRLIETWSDRLSTKDDRREIKSIFFLSTTEERVVPYRPFKIQPTVHNVVYHPFDLSYHVQSRISISNRDNWLLARDLNLMETKKMQHYLQYKLSPQINKSFVKHISWAKKHYAKIKKKARRTGSERFFDKIDLIIRGFSRHRYELGRDEDTDLPKLERFLIKNKTGDCTEFSHTAAILGRMQGVPSRVVRGYLASKSLQTDAHKGGLYHLQKRIKLLQEYSIDDLYLVTTAHAHAWVQYWIPSYGWIDFETTSFAIPPEARMNPNNQDIVIPIIEENNIAKSDFLSKFIIPWRLILNISAFIVASLITVLYSLRYGREIYYLLASKSPRVSKEIKALQIRLLYAFANNAYQLKSYFNTTFEYSEKLPFESFNKFAALYTILQFKEKYIEGEREATIDEARQEFKNTIQNIKANRKSGCLSFLKRIFTLRSLYY